MCKARTKHKNKLQPGATGPSRILTDLTATAAASTPATYHAGECPPDPRTNTVEEKPMIVAWCLLSLKVSAPLGPLGLLAYHRCTRS